VELLPAARCRREADKESVMKKIEAIIRPFKVDEITEALAKARIGDMTLSEVEDYSHQTSRVEYYRGIAYVEDFLSEIKVEIVVADEKVRTVTDTIRAVLQTEHLGDSQITVLPLEEVFHRQAGCAAPLPGETREPANPKSDGSRSWQPGPLFCSAKKSYIR
jgi:nitrogen regulatory protein P-II 1